MPGRRTGPIEIVITVKADGHFLRISVSDNGKGIEETILNKIKAEQIIEDSRGRHIGIYNCVKRLRLFYGEAAIFSVASRPGRRDTGMDEDSQKGAAF